MHPRCPFLPLKRARVAWAVADHTEPRAHCPARGTEADKRALLELFMFTHFMAATTLALARHTPEVAIMLDSQIDDFLPQSASPISSPFGLLPPALLGQVLSIACLAIGFSLRSLGHVRFAASPGVGSHWRGNRWPTSRSCSQRTPTKVRFL